jgi:hypothetical protein
MTVLNAISTAMALLQWIGVFGWGWPNSSRDKQKNHALLTIQEEGTKF